MKLPLAATLAITTALLALGRGPAHAVNNILQPEGVTSNIGTLESNPLENLINQSGLSQSYTSRETPWSEVGNITSNFNPGGGERSLTTWASSSSEDMGIITFDLGSNFLIGGLALWNTEIGAALREFELFVDDDNDFENGATSLGTFNTVRNSTVENADPSISRAMTFPFEEIETRYVHLNVISNFGGNRLILNEIAFQQVPFEFGHLPGVIFAVSLGGIYYFRNKKMIKK